jgi:hypothetical protein
MSDRPCLQITSLSWLNQEAFPPPSQRECVMARAQIRKCRRLPCQRSRSAPLFLRLLCRALGPSAHLEPDRKNGRGRTPRHHPSEEPPLKQNGTRDGLQACRWRLANLAPSQRPAVVAKDHSRCEVLRRARSRYNRRPKNENRRRLIHQAVTKLQT